MDYIYKKNNGHPTTVEKLTTTFNMNGKIESVREIVRFLEGFSDSDKLTTVLESLRQYVNDKVSTDSATFRQTWNLVTDLSLTTAATHSDIATALGTTVTVADNNDYAFVQVPRADATPTKIDHTERYKFNGTAWGYEFDVADPSSIPTTLAELSDDATHRLVTDTEKETWNGKAEVGTAQDTGTANTVYGAKAFTTGSISTESAFQKNFAAIFGLVSLPEFGMQVTVSETGFKIAVTDRNYNILIGKRTDNSWYIADDLDDILDAIIDGYTPNI